MGFERNYQVNVPSNQNLILKINYSIYISTTTIENYNNLNPWWVTGFTDAEGCFGLYIYKQSNYKTGWYVYLVFSISLHQKDMDLLIKVKNFFNTGKIYKHGPETVKYTVKSINDLQKIINHFDNYPLLTQKFKDYKLFKLAYSIFIKKEHLLIEGIEKLVFIQNSMNLGLNFQLKNEFLIPFQILEKTEDIVETNFKNSINQFSLQQWKNINKNVFINSDIKKISDPYWVAGFATGEGCFMIDILKSKSSKLGLTAGLRFIITQNSRDKILMLNLIDYLNCGHLNLKNNCFNFTVRKFKDINNIIIPFFKKYPILGDKLINFHFFYWRWKIN